MPPWVGIPPEHNLTEKATAPHSGVEFEDAYFGLRIERPRLQPIRNPAIANPQSTRVADGNRTRNLWSHSPAL